MAEAGISLSEASKADEDEPDDQPVQRRSFAEILKETSIDELNKMLKTALGNEEYEKAAKIRDEIGKRN